MPSASTTRPLVLQIHSTRLSIPIPSTSESWIAAEVIREEFYHSRAGDEPEPTPTEDEAAVPGAAAAADQEAQVKLLARFLSFVESKVEGTSKSDQAQILLSSYEQFNQLFLATSSVHTATQGYSVDDRALVLTAYFKAFSTLRKIYGESKVVVAQRAAIWKDAQEGKAQVYALFGGQGSNEVSLDWGFILLI
jgi:fatty acid synthase subunit beta